MIHGILSLQRNHDRTVSALDIRSQVHVDYIQYPHRARDIWGGGTNAVPDMTMDTGGRIDWIDTGSTVPHSYPIVKLLEIYGGRHGPIYVDRLCYRQGSDLIPYRHRYIRAGGRGLPQNFVSMVGNHQNLQYIHREILGNTDTSVWDPRRWYIHTASDIRNHLYYHHEHRQTIDLFLSRLADLTSIIPRVPLLEQFARFYHDPADLTDDISQLAASLGPGSCYRSGVGWDPRRVLMATIMPDMPIIDDLTATYMAQPIPYRDVKDRMAIIPSIAPHPMSDIRLRPETQIITTIPGQSEFIKVVAKLSDRRVSDARITYISQPQDTKEPLAVKEVETQLWHTVYNGLTLPAGCDKERFRQVALSYLLDSVNHYHKNGDEDRLKRIQNGVFITVCVNVGEEVLLELIDMSGDVVRSVYIDLALYDLISAGFVYA